MPVTVITRDYFSGGRRLTEDPDAQPELADLLIEIQGAVNTLETAAPTAHAASHVTGGGDVIADAIAAGNSGLMSGADKSKLDGVEALADVTDATNVAAAGALMDPMTAQGDLIHEGAAGPAALAAGAAGQVLGTNGPAADPAWIDAGAAAFVATEAVPGTIWAAPPGPPATIQDAVDRMAAFLAATAAAPIT